MKGPRCDRILANITFAVILAALFNVFAKGDDLTTVPTGASPAGQASTETPSAPTARASESPAATIDTTPAKPANRAVITRVKEADADGLDVRDYRTPNFDGLGPDALAEADLKLTQTVLTFARHLQAGRFPYKLVSQHNIQLPQAPPEPAAILDKIVNATDAGKALDEYSPPHEAYQKLKVKLAEMRANATAPRAAQCSLR